MNMPNSHVGYIGLGMIGKPCALRLVSAGLAAHVYDLHRPAMDELADAGAFPRDSAAEIARACSHIGVCVRDRTEVEAVLSGEDGLFENASPDTVVAIHSTVSQADIVRWAKAANERGLYLIDAPITGGAHKAAAGTLCYMVGADTDILERCRPVFETSAEKIVHAGPVGTGIALKLANNFMQYGEFVLMAEATRLAEACGLSMETLREVGLSNGVVNEQMHMFVSGRNVMARAASEAELRAFFGPLGQLARKDLACALATAGDRSVRLPTAEFLIERIERVFLATDESSP
ncbi:MAG: NAD(P)-dependent oxidoreductase [Gammaproteobacteria bacterium]|nr:NAD(P)-dependent oxidoreductase [Gammaproteobacteria bacterium]MCY4276892.1 NAD(P)-dependent oxidoreductase [Gammaproteobacteria bacterium]